MNITKYLTGLLAVSALLASGFKATAADEKAEAAPYPLTKCIVSGQALGKMGKPVTEEYKGHEIQFCCKDCLAAFNKSPDGFIAKMDAAAKEAAAKEAAAKNPSKMTTCVVSGEKLGGDMGKPFTFVYADKEVKLCCKSCLKEFKKEPAKYMKKMAEASAK